MITEKNNAFVLQTKSTTYAFHVMETGQLEHIYYGPKIRIEDPTSLIEKNAFAPGDTTFYKPDRKDFTLEEVDLEFSAIGKGDIREPMLEVVCADGTTTTDFVFDSFSIEKGKSEESLMPVSYDQTGDVDHLTIVMKDKNHGFTLELHYYAFNDADVIVRSAKFINSSEAEVRLNKMLSMLLDLPEKNFKVTSFHGAWTREMNRREVTVTGGKYVGASFTGTSSNRTNPFFMVSRQDTNETSGLVYGFNLIYSGNHYEAVEVSSFDKTRIVSGINPQNFEFWIEPGQSFETPEAVMTVSGNGFDEMSQHMHDFVHNHITRGEWAKRERPVLLNSWEASYFDITEGSLLKLAKAGADVGVELFVMDDGWFGERNDDSKGLGDWYVNKKKLPNGVAGLAKKVNDLGLLFGIWVEPEMVNPDSDLYRAHPDWTIAIPGMDHSDGRNQRLLDLCNPEVVDYMIEQMSNVFSSGNIAYVKWDFNRIFADYYSPYLDAKHQQEVGHRFVLGYYRLIGTLVKKFPKILFEGCASGGCRFDLGQLCYTPQIWASDNTDAVSRLTIQQGYSYGYPQSAMGAHVSSVPNHQTLRVTPLESRFAVAAFGMLGYECNLCDANKEELEAIKAQIACYKQYRKTLQYGRFHRVAEGNIYQWTIVNEDRTQAVGMVMQKEIKPGEQYLEFRTRGLDPDKNYHFTGRTLKYNIKNFGDLINTQAPFHIRQDSMVHNVISKFVKMDGEIEDCYAYGDAILSGGVKLKQAFVGTGYSDQCRYFPDFGARLYFMDAKESAEAEE